MRSGDEHQWVVIDQMRILIQSLSGSRDAFVAMVFPGESKKTSLEELLSPRQLEIAEYAAAGATGSEIASSLKISVYTVRQHLKEVYRRLHVANRVELNRALYAFGKRNSTIRPPARAQSGSRLK